MKPSKIVQLCLIGCTMGGAVDTVSAQTLDASTGPDAVDVVVGAMHQEGVVATGATEQLRQRLRTRLQAATGKASMSVCSNMDNQEAAAACLSQLRSEVRACVQQTKHRQAIDRSQAAGAGAAKRTANRTPLQSATGVDNAEKITTALVLAASDGEGVQAAGEMIRRQIRSGWTAEEILETASQIGELRDHKRWQKEARTMLKACAAEQNCSATQASVALQVMKRQGWRADVDARQTRRAIHAALQTATVKRQGKTIQARLLSAGELQQRIQKRLLQQSRAARAASTADWDERRQRYQNRAQQEVCQGGDHGDGVGARSSGTRYRGRRSEEDTGDGSGYGGGTSGNGYGGQGGSSMSDQGAGGQ